MKQAMSVTGFCRYAKERGFRKYSYLSCNQLPYDRLVGVDAFFHSVSSDGCIGMLMFRSGDAQLCIHHVSSITVDTEYTAAGTYVSIVSSSPSGEDFRRIILIAS